MNEDFYLKGHGVHVLLLRSSLENLVSMTLSSKSFIGPRRVPSIVEKGDCPPPIGTQNPPWPCSSMALGASVGG